MRKSIHIITILLLSATLLSCEREEGVQIKSNIAPNAMSALSSSSFVLEMDNAEEVFQEFSWTATDYGFSASVSYVVQAAAKGSSFASPITVVGVNNKLTASIKVSEFNKLLLDNGLEPGTPADLEFRIASSVNPNVAAIYSNMVEASVTPYATEFPPIYMCGAATGGWDWTKGVEVRSSAPNLYNTIAYFINNETFRFFKQPDWGPVSYNYPYFTGTVSELFENANDGDQNFRFLGETGYYSVTVNLKTKDVAMEAVAEPKMFMTGAALGGWNWTTDYVQMTWLSNGIFEATTEFINGEAFRFFAQQDWGPTSYNYPYFADGSIDPLFVNADDGDKNFKFVGTTGIYKIKLNMLDLIITMQAQ